MTTHKKKEPEAQPAYYVYMVRCADDTLYTGYAADVQARIRVHNAGQGAKYTRSRLPVELVYSRKCTSKSEALKAEAAIKKLTRKEKLEFIAEAKETS